MNRCSSTAQIQRTSAGFAYLWVLLLVAFMGVGLTVGVEIYTTAVRRDKERELLAIGRQFRGAIGGYYETQLVGGRREYPAELSALLRDNRSPDVKRHLRKVFVDPMTGNAEWGLLRVGGRIAGVHSLSDQTPIKQDNFEAEDAAFRGTAKYSDWVFTYPSDLLLRIDLNDPNSSLPTPETPASQAPLQGAPASEALHSVVSPL